MNNYKGIKAQIENRLAVADYAGAVSSLRTSPATSYLEPNQAADLIATVLEHYSSHARRKMTQALANKGNQEQDPLAERIQKLIGAMAWTEQHLTAPVEARNNHHVDEFGLPGTQH